jgi:lysozyme
MIVTDIFSQLTRDEGVRLQKYRDSRGFDTIGIGHNLDANPLPFDISNGITLAQAEQILRDDVARIGAKLFSALPWLGNLDVARQGVFLNMAFNMGVGGVEAFHHDLADTKAGDYMKAAADMQQSAWYVQVGARAARLCQQMRTGVWQ